MPITPDGQVVLLRQYRFAVQARLRISCGNLEEGEDPLESMQRELGEEAAKRCLPGCPGSDVALPWLLR